MSELINNRENRQATLKQIIRDLHAGQDLEQIKKRFTDLLGQVVSPTEISEMDQALINEGMPVEEIQKLCDVHVAVFREALDLQLEQAVKPQEQAHPLTLFKDENSALSQVLAKIDTVVDRIAEAEIGQNIAGDLKQWGDLQRQLAQIDNHYLRKENILFPFLEKYGITGPPSVMWGIHDDIRGQLKTIGEFLSTEDNMADKRITNFICDHAKPCFNAIREMIYKEENILFPMCLDTLTEDEWAQIGAQSREIGYTLIQPDTADGSEEVEQEPFRDPALVSDNVVQFATGALSGEEICKIFDALPLDITFVDRDDRVKYFSRGGERIFPRTSAVIGRSVQNCHPPASVHIVNKIISDFKDHKRSKAEFWLPVKDMFVYIQYIALYSAENEYMGTLEVTQNIAPLRELKGEKRLDSGE